LSAFIACLISLSTDCTSFFAAYLAARIKDAQEIYAETTKSLFMCDCEELDFEDFQLMLTAISKASRPPTEEVPIRAPLPQLVLARQKK
jgi:hypothetical protein